MIWDLLEYKAKVAANGPVGWLRLRGSRTAEELAKLPRGSRAAALCQAQADDCEDDEPTGCDKLRTGEVVTGQLVFDGDDSRPVSAAKCSIAYSVDGGACEVTVDYTVDRDGSAWLALHVGTSVDVEWRTAQGELL